MSESLQKKMPLIMLGLLIIASIAEVAAKYYGSPETKAIVEKSHFVLAIIVLILGIYLIYAKSRTK
jgi:cadmium resistance protein CadD (predicted permease)